MRNVIFMIPKSSAPSLYTDRLSPKRPKNRVRNITIYGVYIIVCAAGSDRRCAPRYSPYSCWICRRYLSIRRSGYLCTLARICNTAPASYQVLRRAPAAIGRGLLLSILFSYNNCFSLLYLFPHVFIPTVWLLTFYIRSSIIQIFDNCLVITI